jgi:hypothetical protein
MNHREYINSRANDYKQYLLEDLERNVAYTKVVDSVFFPSNSNIQERLEWTEVRSFYEYTFKGEAFINRICTRNEIDNIPLVGISGNISRYTIFSYLACNTYEEAAKKFPLFYHLVQKDFYKIIDRLIFDRLIDYKREASDIHRYTKRISNHINLTLSTAREYMDIKGIIGYTLPFFSIDVKGKDRINLGTIDVRSLLFLPESSFLFFSMDSHDYTIDELSSTISGVKRKNDEPIIYHLEDEQKYMVTNSWKNIDRYNKYIQIIVELSFHYFKVFEKWLTLQSLTDSSAKE